MIRHLTLGGGVVSAGVDLGFCTDFEFDVDSKWDFSDSVASSDGGITLLKGVSSVGQLKSIDISGSFKCESITPETIYSLCTYQSTGGPMLTMLDAVSPLLTPLTFTGDPLQGSIFLFSAPRVHIFLSGGIKPQKSREWMSLHFQFDVKMSVTDDIPSLTISTVGE